MIRPTDSPLLFIEYLGGQILSFNTLASRTVPAAAIIIPISNAISRYYLHTARYINPSLIGFLLLQTLCSSSILSRRKIDYPAGLSFQSSSHTSGRISQVTVLP
jgi:hypothetical protein